MRAIPARAVDLVKEFEGFRATAYLCPAGVWTIGWGHVGPGVKEGLACTRRMADLWLKEDLRAAGNRLAARIGPVVADLTDNQYAALCSFIFNLGADPKWTLWKKLKARDFDAVPAQLARFVYAGGKKLNGLVRRRNAEIALWSEAEPGSEDENPSSAETRFAETPPAPAEKPKAAPVITAALSACGAVPVAAKAVTDAVSPWADASPWVGQFVAFVATLAAGAAIAVLVLNWLQRQRARR